MAPQTRIEKDSMGELAVPESALYGAQTQRAVDNFQISALKMPRYFIKALGLIKKTAATVNQSLNLLDATTAKAIAQAADQVAAGQHDEHFPVDVFQTGSGTSSNMNSNEVIARLATDLAGQTVHPNDHVNMGQSSNDVIPTAIHVSSALALHEQLLPALEHLAHCLQNKAAECHQYVKTGRTHLMDAMPVRLSQELLGWHQQITQAISRIKATGERLTELAQGGTAVGTGVNAHPDFAHEFAANLATQANIGFKQSPNFFTSLSTQDTAVELSGQLKTLAVSLMKISNDLRWMNSGPLAGLGEIQLQALQPGSSIMPGKVNPVIPEAVCMVAAHVIGNDSAITVAGQSGNFQLNVMLPLVGHHLLQNIELLTTASQHLADKAITTFTVNTDNLTASLDKNPILVTALNSKIGYDKAAAIAKLAYAQKRPILEVALEQTDLPEAELKQLLDPALLTGE